MKVKKFRSKNGYFFSTPFAVVSKYDGKYQVGMKMCGMFKELYSSDKKPDGVNLAEIGFCSLFYFGPIVVFAYSVGFSFKVLGAALYLIGRVLLSLAYVFHLDFHSARQELKESIEPFLFK